MIAPRPPPFFIADHPGLDFLNTIAVPVDAEVEWLASGEDLLAWLRQCGLVTKEIVDDFRANAAPGELDRIAAQARALRDWFKLFVYHRMGRQLDAAALADLTPLNQLLARDEEFVQIAVRDQLREHDHASHKRLASGLAWRKQRRWRSPETLLLPVARSLADLVCSENFADVKGCEGASCTLLFLDRTRGRVRRWCSMAVCGNRAKQAAHRNRTKQTHSRREADL
jgi:predicted RNA-binding Zn ribbon-like protein